MGARERLLAKFRTVAQDRLAALDAGFGAVQERPDDAEAIATLLRENHSLKGEARMMGFPRINDVAHSTEELLHAAHDAGFGAVEPALAEAFLLGLDLMGALLDQGEDVVPPERLSAFHAAADAALGRAADEPEAAAPPPGAPAVPPAMGAAPVRAPHPPPTPAGIAPPPQTEEPAQPEPPVAGRGGGEELLRVSVRHLDAITDGVGALLMDDRRDNLALAQLMGPVEELRQLARGLADQHVEAAGLLNLIEQMRTLFAQVGARMFDRRVLLQRLQEDVTSLRLVPLSSVFQRYPRAMRELARERGKDLRVELRGGDVELDKRVLDALDEALLHISRNSVDHGIEAPEVRTHRGKDPVGRVRIEARRAGAMVEVAVADDGGGIDVESLVERAVGNGVLSEREARLLSPLQRRELIFRAGLSTAQSLSDVSGRGIGMAAVRERVRDLGGTVAVHTEPGRGTRITLRVPPTMMVSRLLLVDVDGQSFALPADSIVEVGLCEPAEVELAGEGMVVRVEGRLVPLADVAWLLQGEARVLDHSQRFPVVVVEDAGRRVALRVDALIGEQELLQHPLGELLGGLSPYLGTATLVGGDVVLVLSVAHLRRATMERGRSGFEVDDAPAAVGGRVLVVDDSEFTRDLVVGVLQGIGYEVVEAVDGRDGLRVFAEEQPDLVLTDLDMPVLDGFGLIEELRAGPGAEVPVVVLSTRGSDEDKRRAAEAGADGYLVKAEFREEELARILGRYLRGSEGGGSRG